ncbi:hypothetical protein CLV33_11810 [Jejuia pallidilutea]|uniref:Uncharacterized protein n=1 Tax=Jejuia pallidilutea TaxID=504487 RepID=A0A362X4L7_9FLAO|nr:hypothetical protein [Jejuia pallidilutea]PQV44731.1 hypothetical protein CLV33_11810 [Jejuia pallidilutea]
MSRGLKIALIIISILIVLILGGGYFALKTIGEAFGADCEISNTWTINEYEIIENKCLGWAGPHYYPLDLKKNGEYIASSGYKLDSCNFRFEPKNGQYLILNICDKEITELKSHKSEIDIEKVDSIIMVSGIDPNKRIKLNQNKTERFVKDWNKSKVSDYRDGILDSIFHPNYQYKLIVFENRKKKEFVTFNFLIADESNWTYYITNDSDKDYMNRLWNE